MKFTQFRGRKEPTLQPLCARLAKADTVKAGQGMYVHPDPTKRK